MARSALAQSTPVNQFAVTINIVGPGTVTLDPPGGIYYRDTTVKLIATPAPGYVFSGYSGDFKGWMNLETMRIDANKNFTATFSLLPTPRYSTGIWTSAAEISELPTSGLGWENMKAGADKPIGPPNLSNHEDSVNVAVLAKALVYARTGEEAYRQAVISACMAAMGTEQSGETLYVGRELLAYVVAADLVGLPPAEKAAFQNWLRSVLTKNLQGHTLRSSHEVRPNNWGTHCGATR
ncbi:MAG: InlB B-repeat-containing protein, partial [bacterium]